MWILVSHCVSLLYAEPDEKTHQQLYHYMYMTIKKEKTTFCISDLVAAIKQNQLKQMIKPFSYVQVWYKICMFTFQDKIRIKATFARSQSLNHTTGLVYCRKIWN